MKYTIETKYGMGDIVTTVYRNKQVSGEIVSIGANNFLSSLKTIMYRLKGDGFRGGYTSVYEEEIIR